MAESSVNVTEGSGKRLHTYDRTISSVEIQDQFVLPGEYPYPTYSVTATSISAATLGDHVLQLMAGSSLHVRVRYIRIAQATATGNTQTFAPFSVYRLTTAGSSGTSTITPSKFNLSDAAAGATAITLPSSKGTDTAYPVLLVGRFLTLNAVTSTGTAALPCWEWRHAPGTGPIIIPAGTNNGICIKSAGSLTGLTVDIHVEFVETSFL